MNDIATIERDPAIELQRNIELLKSHGQAIERLRALEAELSQLDIDEQNEIARYTGGYTDAAPTPRDDERQRLATLLAEARPNSCVSARLKPASARF
jgi:hypothetical protein